MVTIGVGVVSDDVLVGRRTVVESVVAEISVTPPAMNETIRL